MLIFQTLSRINVTINVLDVNDNPPLFEKDDYSFEIPSQMRPNMELGRLWVLVILLLLHVKLRDSRDNICQKNKTKNKFKLSVASGYTTLRYHVTIR